VNLTRARLQISCRTPCAFLANPFEGVLLRSNKPPHVATEKEQVGEVSNKAEGRFPLQGVSHDRQLVLRFEFMDMAEPLERAVDHLIDEPVGSVQYGNFGNEALSHTEMPAFKGDQIIKFEKTLQSAGFDNAFRRKRGGFGVDVHVASEIEAEFDGRADSCFDGDRTHYKKL
jgi:hypothetical protein